MSGYTAGKHYLLDLKSGIYLVGMVVDASEQQIHLREECRMGPADSKFVRSSSGAADFPTDPGTGAEIIQMTDIIRHWEFEQSPYDEVFDLSREGLFALLKKASNGVSL